MRSGMRAVERMFAGKTGKYGAKENIADVQMRSVQRYAFS